MTSPFQIYLSEKKDEPIFGGLVKNPEINDIIKFTRIQHPTEAELEVMSTLKHTELYRGWRNDKKEGMFTRYAILTMSVLYPVSIFTMLTSQAAVTASVISASGISLPIYSIARLFYNPQANVTPKEKTELDVSKYRTLDMLALEQPKDVVEVDGIKYGKKYAPN